MRGAARSLEVAGWYLRLVCGAVLPRQLHSATPRIYNRRTYRSAPLATVGAEGRLASAGPPVPVAEDTHGGRDEEDADDGGVHEDGDGQAEADGLGEYDTGKREGAGDDDDDRGCRGDDAGGRDEALGDARRVRVAVLVGLADAGEQEDLVVHRDPEDRAEHEYGERRVHEAQRREVQQAREVAVLEDEDDGAVAGGEAQDVDDDGLQGEQDRAEREEQYKVGNPDHEPRRQRRLPVEALYKVLLPRGEPPNQEARPLRGVHGAHGVHRPVGPLGVGVLLGDGPYERPVPGHVGIDRVLKLVRLPGGRELEKVSHPGGRDVAVGGDPLG